MDGDYAGNKWHFGASKDARMKNFYTWNKLDGLDSEGDTISGEEH